MILKMNLRLYETFNLKLMINLMMGIDPDH